MASTFNLLTAGARFNKSRFQKDMELFEKKERKGKGNDKAKRKDVALPSSLNFFGDRSAAPKTEPEPQSESEDEDFDSVPDIPEPPKQKITLTGPDPLPSSLGTDLPALFKDESPLRKPLIRALNAANIHSLWGVQCAVSGSLLAGHDTMCIAPTGSGKTLSYLLPTLVQLRQPARKLGEEGKGIRALILVPTHDLAVQIHGVLKAITAGQKWRCMVLSKATQKAVCDSAPGRNSGSDEEEEKEESEGEEEEGGLGIDVLVATPERLHHLLDEGRVSLASTRHLILDESDRLLGPDFLPQVEPIVDATGEEVQKALFSATMPAGAEELARRWLKDGGVRVVVGVKDSAVTTVDQSLLFTGSEAGKTLALANLIAEGGLPYPSLIFVQSIERADELSKQLVLDGVRAEAVHSGRGKSKRDAAIDAFRRGDAWVLVVTDVLARGMDFRGVKVVVNYDFPQTVQSYIHRIGRTGRAGRPGKALTFFSNEDAPYLRTIANVLRASGCPVPEYMLQLKKPSKNQKRKLAKAPVERKAVGGGGRDVAAENAKRKRAMIEGSKRRKVKA
ncbi:ATP-dependent RNA helicase ROK1 [Cutaneotrichosporon oleaginosum]|uniref:RNA helicase n=1 Tax=Cutaneotrichosporon oleaginosum TaxID=879819 RepID=A0A0J0XYA6_9TREE|nr:ATP-dependent RNA helicase ROK1 [Cutaneotrichosporon oleaginosum]KLT46016.1 ATP-dependent RNA helicase ROK1 [Cutaneotrichosporon oleaginosum]TXT06710.1 hypothetical protein COLE_06041 [Cutaneotrichosporon oleaginosum]